MGRVQCALAVLSLGACTATIDGNPGDGDGDDPGPDNLPGDSYEEAPIPAPLDDDARGALGATLDSILATIGTTQSVIVVDLESGQTIYEKDADRLLIPASNTKLFTSAAAMSALGSDHRFATQAYATTPIEGGVIAGDLYVVGNHDFTASTYFYPQARLPLDRFARAVADAGVTRVEGDVILAGEMLYQGYNFGSYNASNARAAAVVQLEGALNAAGIETGVIGATPSFDPPEGAELIAEHGSATLGVAFVPLNVISHNEFADITMRHIGLMLGGESSYAQGGTQALAHLESAGLDITGLALADGSGLSRQNRVSARSVADLLALTLESPEGSSFLRTLTIGGIRGTLGNRLSGPRTAGRFFGKTGTLTGVIATSGVLFHPQDDRRYLISVLMNDVGSNATARSVQDQVIEAVAGDLRGAEAPATPTLLSVVNERSNRVVLSWTPVDGADGYIVWLSRDGETWARADARYVTGSSYTGDDIDDGNVFVRVTAFSELGGESAPSDTYVLTAKRTASRVLLVDGNDRYQAEPALENPAGLSHAFACAYGAAFAEPGIDTVANEVVISGDVNLDDYDAVIWMLGDESTIDEALDRSEQLALMSYLGGGGNLLISGSELGWDLVERGDAMDAAFYRDVLKSEYIADASGSYAALMPGDERLDFYNPGVLDVAFADVLATSAGSEVVLEYEAGGAAGTFYDGAYRVINVGFPIETIDSQATRNDVLSFARASFSL